MLALKDNNLIQPFKNIFHTNDSNVIYGENILIINFNEGVEIDASAAKNLVQQWKNYLGNEKNPDSISMIFNMGGLKSITREARVFYADLTRSGVKSMAVIANSSVSHVIANFFISFYPTGIPARLFSVLDDAIIWSKQIQKTG